MYQLQELLQSTGTGCTSCERHQYHLALDVTLWPPTIISIADDCFVVMVLSTPP